MKTKYKDTSRRRTPWDNKDVLSPIETFIKSKYLDNFNHKHLKLVDTEEAAFLNTYNLEACKHCHSIQFKKNGYTRSGIQKYKCSYCGKTFTILTGTLFQNHKISITEWLEFCLDIFGYGSISLTSKVNKNSYTTSRYWLEKLFILIEDIHTNIVLSGNVQIDETYFPVMKSDKVLKDGKELRGLSRNQFCIAIAYDGTNVYAKVEGVGKTSQLKTREAFIDHIKVGSHLIHDKEKSHRVLIKELNLTEDVYDAKELKKLDDKDNPLNAINKQCYLLKRFLHSHSGFDRENLQDYINLFCFIQNPPYDRLEKVAILLDSAIRSDRTLKYREFYSNRD